MREVLTEHYKTTKTALTTILLEVNLFLILRLHILSYLIIQDIFIENIIKIGWLLESDTDRQIDRQKNCSTVTFKQELILFGH